MAMSSEPGTAWRTITIEGGTPPVDFARLDRDRVTGAFVALVRFPPGWRRPSAGRYAVDEEVLILEGELRMSGVTYQVDDYAYLPGGYARVDSVASHGALTIASFTGPADWSATPDNTFSGPPAPAVRWRALAPRDSVIGRRARPLHEAGPRSTWMIDGPLEARAPDDARVQLFSLSTRSWASVEPGASIPALRTPCLCWLRRVSRDAVATSVDRDLSDV